MVPPPLRTDRVRRRTPNPLKWRPQLTVNDTHAFSSFVQAAAAVEAAQAHVQTTDDAGRTKFVFTNVRSPFNERVRLAAE